MSRGSEAYTARSKEWQAQTRDRKARAARQKAAREALAYPDAPNGLTPEVLRDNFHAMRVAFYAREAGRRAA